MGIRTGTEIFSLLRSFFENLASGTVSLQNLLYSSGVMYSFTSRKDRELQPAVVPAPGNHANREVENRQIREFVKQLQFRPYNTMPAIF